MQLFFVTSEGWLNRTAPVTALLIKEINNYGYTHYYLACS